MVENYVLSGRYELQHELGRGGMGTVHRAVDLRLRRLVAVKTLSAELAHDPLCRARLQREAHAVAALNHPAVATIHDVAEDEYDGAVVPYLVMEYVDGVTLAELLLNGPMQVDQAVELVCQVLDALEHSHRHGILHRDVKPANIMLTATGAVKVLDFGIAKALTEAATRLTGTGLAVGTPASLSPEQINGVDADHRADLYAVGCLLYQLLTGVQPFTGDSPFTIMHQHLTADPVPPSLRRPGLTPALDAVVLTALRKDRSERHPDAAAMRAALADVSVVGTLPPTLRLSPPNPARPAPGPTALQPWPTDPEPPAGADAATASGFAEAETGKPWPGGPGPVGNAEAAWPGGAGPAGTGEAWPGGAGVGAEAPEVGRSWAGVRLHPTAEGALALLGCLLAALCGRMHMVEAPHFAAVALLAALGGGCALLWSARLACAISWGPVAETLAVQSEFRRAYLGWDAKPVLLALALVAMAVVCAARCLSRRRADGGFAAVGAWFAGTAALWFFLDDQNKTAVFYALLAATTAAVGTAELLRRRASGPVRVGRR
ncbi:protein kinase domain-containing protein [Streptacidiphilus jiangxiensis]|uniref:non-specific serine/threonine protein kinase n=1 Tax=Streptacidiphilus jiangxiensis TaxID=235985 RepID=A0A1H7YYN4_STRJI|nr:protein kinase [Streptacidiphilus jiangxiensis]SEM51095.1 serine/threonine protein kinase [Streptacidiphilus jiangxiensis]